MYSIEQILSNFSGISTKAIQNYIKGTKNTVNTFTNPNEESIKEAPVNEKSKITNANININNFKNVENYLSTINQSLAQQKNSLKQIEEHLSDMKKWIMNFQSRNLNNAENIDKTLPYIKDAHTKFIEILKSKNDNHEYLYKGLYDTSPISNDQINNTTYEDKNILIIDHNNKIRLNFLHASDPIIKSVETILNDLSNNPLDSNIITNINDAEGKINLKVKEIAEEQVNIDKIIKSHSEENIKNIEKVTKVLPNIVELLQSQNDLALTLETILSVIRNKFEVFKTPILR